MLQAAGNNRAQQQRPLEAIMYFKRATELDPNNPIAQYNLGCALANADRPHEALACFRRVLELDHSNTLAQKNIDMLSGLGSDSKIK
jgi:Flp pilus assembly protein TadD